MKTSSAGPVGQFAVFNVLAQGIPTGTAELVFKAIQAYSDGTVVSWIQVPTKTVPNPVHPAPTLALSAAATAGTSAAPASSARSGAATVVVGSGNDAESIAALILAGFAVLLSVLAVWLGRPRFGERDAPAEDGG